MALTGAVFWPDFWRADVTWDQQLDANFEGLAPGPAAVAALVAAYRPAGTVGVAAAGESVELTEAAAAAAAEDADPRTVEAGKLRAACGSAGA